MPQWIGYQEGTQQRVVRDGRRPRSVGRPRFTGTRSDPDPRCGLAESAASRSADEGACQSSCANQRVGRRFTTKPVNAEPAQWSLKWQHPSRVHENQNSKGHTSDQGTFPYHEPAGRFLSVDIVPTHRVEPGRHAGKSDRREDKR
jgi:hypothetical protein